MPPDGSNDRPGTARAVSASETAVSWLILMRSDDVSEEDQTAFRSWLDESPDNAGAFQSVENTMRRCRAIPGMARGAVRETFFDRSSRRDMLRGALALTGSVGIGAFCADRLFPLSGLAADIVTSSRRDIALADDGKLTLDGRSALDWIGAARQPMIRLRSGAVRIATGSTEAAVIVAGGASLHLPRGGAATVTELDAGRVLFAAQGEDCWLRCASHARLSLAAPRIVDRNGQAASPLRDREGLWNWVDGVAIAHGDRLGDVAAILARQSFEVLLVSAAAAGQRVIGRFPMDRPADALEMLAETLAVTVRRIPGIATVILA